MSIVEKLPKDQQPTLVHAEPVLAVKNVAETVAYWHEVLGFREKWMWGDPPNHGGVSWQGAAFIQFSLDPKLAAVSEGHSVWFRVRNLENLYQLHREKANVVSPPEIKPWGSEEYIVRDINGYYLHFSAPASRSPQKSEPSSTGIRIMDRKPTFAEFAKLARSVGWEVPPHEPDVEKLWKSVVYAVVAEDIETGEAVGCAFLLGDNISIYYVKDVIVHPAQQRSGIGTVMMQKLTDWLEANAPNLATVGLFTGDHLAAFYRPFGFIQACGMYRQIHR
jgi:GNAT superfamily N-acetyltransferase/uncharacterized glyoxalase superfamily protein PhnB